MLSDSRCLNMIQFSIILFLFGVILCAPNTTTVERNKEPELKLVPRIALGRVVDAYSIPYQAGLKISGNVDGVDEFWFCGGTLISKNYIITAAFCAEHATRISIVLGAHNIKKTEATQVKVSSKRIIIHPDYISETKKNDIALIELDQPVPLRRNIQTVRLPGYSEAKLDYEGKKGKISGWGLLDGYDTDFSPVLNSMEEKIVSNDECEELFKDVTDTNICVSGNSGSSTCSADTGGPLTVNGILIGIVSFQEKFCEEGFPSVLTRVTKYLDWIETNSDVGIKP